MQTLAQPALSVRAPSEAGVFLGIAAGLIAGLAYLAAQMIFAATLLDGSMWDPLHRIAAVLLGQDAAPPAVISFTVIGMALLIHLPLAGLYGRALASLCRGCTLPGALSRGALMGLAIFVFNFWVLAPLAFPWFEQSRNVITAGDHVLFGVVTAICYMQLIRRDAGARQRS